MPRLRRLAVVGWIVGGVLGGLPFWAEAAQGLAHRLGGGTGEAAAWGGAAATAVLRLVLPSEWTAGGALALVLLGLLAPRARRGERVRRRAGEE